MRQLGLLIGFSLAMLAARTATAGDGCCEAKCPSCDYTCELKIDNSPVKKHCWRIEYKPICIPKVTFPWQKGCDCGKGGKGGDCCAGCNGCAKVKYVKVLVKEEYECPSCKCKFTPVPCGKGYKDGGSYDAGSDGSDDGIPADPPSVRNNHGVAPAPITVGQIRRSDHSVQQASSTQASKKASLYDEIKGLLK